ncbi:MULTISPECIES: proton-conducting transporter membrane subunit [unclassified Saccharopolyspora]|uniref:proton-conducting transporter transmembrane domain-containing protein n=1 Tax=unclassified Saccharopolyspora TaxID=2646250 RepID=UPI001CD20E1A|nr:MULTISPECIES: proton-conducting transporter membrane subunit [unclassified Saccharopolyspora]MCA1186223.1 hydrogenase [Saccharopolyspora sp. 6T]MCA1278425.1 hydrogenase [Saccharopolyspora sp. 7B]
MIHWLLIAAVAVPLVGAAGCALAGWHRATSWVGVVTAALVLLASAGVALSVVENGPTTALHGMLRADALTAFMLVLTGTVTLLAAFATPEHLAVERAAGRLDSRAAVLHCVLVQVFVGTMTLAVLAANLGVMWVAVEAATIATALLVGQQRTRSAVEAAWKYVVICSAGIGLALLGVFLLNYASLHTGAGAGLDWSALVSTAASLDPAVTRIAGALLIIGFGAKAGLAPLHAWVPDAYGQAPAPVAALMSGGMLAVSFYAVLRVKMIADVALGPGFVRVLLVILALMSLAVSASLLIAQRDYKRMLGYSSIEHVGLAALGAGIGGRLAIAAVLLHIFGHGLVKTVLFLGSGRMSQLIGTSRVDGARGLAVRYPVLAGCFGLGVLALAGMPPFSLFASEIGIAREGFRAGLGWAVAVAFFFVLMIGASLLVHTSRMLLGASSSGRAEVAPPRTGARTEAVLLTGLVASVVLGAVGGLLDPLLPLTAELLSGTP